ncbi:hypothetical protein HZH68_002198 [Vespula germanica]|uniref:Uncharacterized protein n=3 Tax=Vespula TaxID=7451 RepID=A0A834KTE6_VESGE|nr:hypothetical protein HZH66_001962 [Vespula vulgaris]KAF7413709.1 hypothetical protein HZH68_002198 [Vespula germanica]KAF7434220.1 hypothetical protein H0235_002411 [Vespula pensylvanica]
MATMPATRTAESDDKSFAFSTSAIRVQQCIRIDQRCVTSRHMQETQARIKSPVETSKRKFEALSSAKPVFPSRFS